MRPHETSGMGSPVGMRSPGGWGTAAAGRGSGESSRVSTEFSLSASELQAMTHCPPRWSGQASWRRRQDFLRLVANALDEPADFFLLVDKSHKLAADYEPDDLVNLKTYPVTVSLGDLRLRKAIMPAVTGDGARRERRTGSRCSSHPGTGPSSTRSTSTRGR